MRISSELKRNLLYYLMFVVLYYLVYTIAVSFVAFIYFILDHNLNDIDTWLAQNSWEIIVLSKIISMGAVIRLVNLNSNRKFKDFLKKSFKLPSAPILIVCIFISVTFYALILQFSGGLLDKNSLSDFTMQSALGSFLFYFIDFLVIIYLNHVYKLTKKKSKLIFIIFSLTLFILMTKFTLIYLSKYLFFVILNLLFMSLIVFKDKNSLINTAVYGLTIISPLASVYGLDLIWDDRHALYSYKDQLPYMGIFGTWLIAYLYYFRKV